MAELVIGIFLMAAWIGLFRVAHWMGQLRSRIEKLEARDKTKGQS